MPDPRIKNEDQYEALVDKGYSKKKQPASQIQKMPEKKEKKRNLMKNGTEVSCINKQKMLI